MTGRRTGKEPKESGRARKRERERERNVELNSGGKRKGSSTRGDDERRVGGKGGGSPVRRGHFRFTVHFTCGWTGFIRVTGRAHMWECPRTHTSGNLNTDEFERFRLACRETRIRETERARERGPYERGPYVRGVDSADPAALGIEIWVFFEETPRCRC